MSSLTPRRPALTVLTDATCGDACWHAREETCRCSCGGANHGCLRVAGAEQPARTARIDGHVFTLRAVGSYSELYDETRRIRALAHASKRYGWMQKTPDFPACLRAASAAQIAGWPELAGWRSTPTLQRPAAYLLWVQVEELASLEGGAEETPAPTDDDSDDPTSVLFQAQVDRRLIFGPVPPTADTPPSVVRPKRSTLILSTL